MIAAFIFILHIILIIYAFIRFKKEGIGEGFLAVAFIAIIFAVGWTIATIITNLLFSVSWIEKWYWQPVNTWFMARIRKEFSRDTISLLMLTICEIIFYYFFFITGKGKKTDDSSGSATSI